MKERIQIPSLKELHIKILDFPDIQSLLNEYLDRCKANDKRLSRRYFNEVAFEKSTPGYLQSILGKKYKFSDDTVERLIQVMQITNEEAEYLYVLTRIWDLETGFQLTAASFSKLESETLPTKLTKRLESLKNQIFPTKDELAKAVRSTIGPDWKQVWEQTILKAAEVEGRNSLLYKCLYERYEKLRNANVQVIHLTSWGHLVVFRLIQMWAALGVSTDDLFNPKFIRDRLHPHMALTPAEIKKCLDDLQTERVIIRKDTGIEINENWKIASDFLWVKKYHRDIMDQASRSLEVSSQEREYQSIFISTTPEKLAEIKRQINEDKIQLRKAASAKDGSLLVSVSWQMFPITEIVHKHSTEEK